MKGQKKGMGREQKKYSKKVDVYFSLNILTIITEIYKKRNSKIKKLELKNIQATDIE